MKLNFFEHFIEKQYKENKIDNKYPDDKGNVMICCPFPHKKTVFNNTTWLNEEVEYYEEKPSCSINLDMRVFHCFVCDRTFNEIEFAEQILKKPRDFIIKEYSVIEELKSVSEEWEHNQHQHLLNNQDALQKVLDLKMNMETIKEVKLGYITNCLAVPVFKNGNLVNIVRYNINKLPDIPKVRYNENSASGDIVPFDIWKHDLTRPTIFCEGEKDMLIARSHGFNAITLTGGSQANIQEEYFKNFENRDVYICYDNDDAGRRGSYKLYKDLLKHCKSVRIVDISVVCKEEKEDVADFFNKYRMTALDFNNLLTNHSKCLTKEDLEGLKTKYELPITKLFDNIKKGVIKKKVKSCFQIIATSTETYAVPEYALFKLREIKEESEENKMPNLKSWYLNDSKNTFLELMEGKVLSRDVPNILATICGLGKKWNTIYTLEQGPLQPIYKVTVADQVTDNDDGKSTDFTIDLYSRQPLEIGSIYEIEYKIYPHPKMGQKLIAVAHNVLETEYEFDTNNEEYKKELDVFKETRSISEKIEHLFQSARCYIAPYLNKSLWFMMDLVFNSPLNITYGKVIRGALDVFVLGDTRTGKSETSKALTKLYEFGEVVPLKTATVASLVGGTDDKLKKTKLGILPRYHKELVVMEEFSGAPMDFLKTLTEIRSSSMVKIYRVAGDIKAPCKLRMITISNPISDSGNLMTLSSYPNGIEPINELIKSPEDIARYDMFTLVPAIKHLSNPFNSVLQENFKIPKQAYELKSKWIKSLDAESVMISDELGSYIFEKGLELNSLFECSFTLFGSETDKKIARLSAALACMLCSTEDYKSIIVKKEHVDFIVNFIKHNYDNDSFRLKDFAVEEKAYSVVVEEDTRKLEELYPKNTTIIEFLANTSKVNRNELSMVSGLTRDDFTTIFNVFVSRKFIKVTKDQVSPTVKFRETYRIMTKNYNIHDKETLLEGNSVF